MQERQKSTRKHGNVSVLWAESLCPVKFSSCWCFCATANPFHEKKHSRKEQHHLTATKCCHQLLQALLPTAPVGWSTALNASWLWLPCGTEAPPGHRSLGQEPGTSAARARGSGRSASAGTLPVHLLMSLRPGPQGSEQHSCPAPHVPRLCHTTTFRMATRRDVSHGGRASFCGSALPVAAALATTGAPSATQSLQSRGTFAYGLSRS